MRIFERSTTVSYGHDADRARTLGFYHAIYADDAGSRSFPFLSNDSLLNKLDTQVKFRPRPRLHRQVNFTNSFDVTFDGKSAKIILSELESIERSVTDANVQNDITAEDQQKEYIQVIKTELHESADNKKVIAVADAGEECVKDEVLGEDDSATTFRPGDGSEYGPLINESENGTDNCRNDYMTVNEQELQRKGNSGDCHYKGANNGIVLIICDHVEAQANVDTATTERFDEDKSEINDQVLCKTKNKVTNNNYVETYEKNTEEIECDDSDSDSSYMIDVFDKCEGTYVNLQDGFATCRIMSPGLQEKINEQKYQVEDSELVYLQIVDGRIVFKPRDMCLEIDHDDSYFIDALFFDDSR
ncbi:hypothetical protein DPMN_083573 [Dreissena polymorpha]|uniref:Uncharacterized protein n=1 Tax=Dreissena polymorpha TaxID=45954 RepID=A0A9D3Y9K5_DREPO|nr:hypothetical protein DPMN_083573 [Dreissena polymorpha]